MKRFHTRDGMGIELLQKAGVKVALMTGEASPIVQKRAAKLSIADIYLGVKDKAAKLPEFLQQHGLTAEDVVYVGDDVNDVGIMELVGFPIAVADAVEEVKAVADYITERKGGEGAVREVAELILMCR